MKQFVILITIVCSINTLIGQNQFSKGFEKGWKAGYCYQEVGCFAPISPATPVPHYSESYDSYKDGYSKGFQMGLDNSRSSSSVSYGASTTVGATTAISTDFGAIVQNGVQNLNRTNTNVQRYETQTAKYVSYLTLTKTKSNLYGDIKGKEILMKLDKNTKLWVIHKSNKKYAIVRTLSGEEGLIKVKDLY